MFFSPSFGFKLWPTVFSEQHILLIIFLQPPQVFFSSANSPHPAKPALALHWGAREEKKKKTGAGDFFFHFIRCAKFMMRVQNGNYQAVCLPLAVWFSVVISVCFQFVVEM